MPVNESEAAVRLDAYLERATEGSQRLERIRRARRELPLMIASSVERSATPMAAEASGSSASLLLSEGPPIPIGDALHLTMERVTLPEAEDLEAIGAAVCADGGTDDHLEEVLELARRCLETPIVRRAMTTADVHREVPFTMPADDGGFVRTGSGVEVLETGW